jgi:hypothetical protein
MTKRQSLPHCPKSSSRATERKHKVYPQVSHGQSDGTNSCEQGRKKRQRVNNVQERYRPSHQQQKSRENSKKNKGHWWKEDAVPTFHAVWPALVKLVSTNR